MVVSERQDGGNAIRISGKDEGRTRDEESIPGGPEEGGGRGWQGRTSVSTRDLLDRLGLGERWRDEKVGTRVEWKRKVRQIIGQEERRWW